MGTSIAYLENLEDDSRRRWLDHRPMGTKPDHELSAFYLRQMREYQALISQLIVSVSATTASQIALVE